MQVRDIMSSPVVRVPLDATLRDAVSAMLEERVGSVTVGDPGPAGIVTRSDVLRSVYREGRALDDVAVRTAMTADVITASPEAAVESALRRMADHDVKKLPVTDGLDLVGIVTLTDVGRHLPDRVAETRRAVERRDDWTD